MYRVTKTEVGGSSEGSSDRCEFQKTFRSLSMYNIEAAVSEYVTLIGGLGHSLVSLRGLPLLHELKRPKVKVGPYPDVCFFEAANRIMSDLVILHGVRWLLDRKVFPFDTYTVQYGNESEGAFDIRAANSNGETLIGEAFNVAPSFFQIKKSAMLRKLRNSEHPADVKVIVVNDDALSAAYVHKLQTKEHLVRVNIENGNAELVPRWRDISISEISTEELTRSST